jgi:hypothetical protein
VALRTPEELREMSDSGTRLGAFNKSVVCLGLCSLFTLILLYVAWWTGMAVHNTFRGHPVPSCAVRTLRPAGSY